MRRRQAGWRSVCEKDFAKIIKNENAVKTIDEKIKKGLYLFSLLKIRL